MRKQAASGSRRYGEVQCRDQAEPLTTSGLTGTEPVAAREAAQLASADPAVELIWLRRLATAGEIVPKLFEVFQRAPKSALLSNSCLPSV